MIQAKHTNRYKVIQQIETGKESSLSIKQTKAIVQSPHPGDVGKQNQQIKAIVQSPHPGDIGK